jgi:Protein of unknown function (DUF3107)
VEVKIGVLHTPREIIIESSQTPSEVEKLVSAAIGAGEGVLTLTDKAGRKVIVAASLIAYADIDQADVRRVGFVAG